MSDLQIKLGDQNGDVRHEIAFLDCIDGEPFRDKVDMASGKEREESIKRAVRHFGHGSEDIPELSRQLAKLAAEALTQNRPLPPILTLKELYDQQLCLPDELIQGVLHGGSKLSFGGTSKGFKTWTLQALSMAVASGLPWLGFETRRAKVLHIDMELQKPFLDRRLATLQAAMHAPADVEEWLDVWCLRGFTAGHQEVFPRIIERIDRKGYGLVTLDPIYKLYGQADENKAGDIAALMNSIENLTTQTGAAVAFGAHFSKGNQSGKEAIDRISGSGVFARDPDSLVNLTVHEEPDCFTLECTLRNFPPVRPIVVHWNFPLFKRRSDLDPAALKKPGRPRQYSADGLIGKLVNGMTAGEWEKASGMSNETYLKYRRQLEESKQVQYVNQRWEKSR